VGRPLEHDDRDAARDDQLVDHPHRAAGIFRRIHLDPLAPANTNYLLWTILGFLIVIAVLVVTLGRLGDIYGRVRTYNLGYAVFTVFSILAATPLSGAGGALWLIGMRIG
jgi:MFS family permease